MHLCSRAAAASASVLLTQGSAPSASSQPARASERARVRSGGWRLVVTARVGCAPGNVQHRNAHLDHGVLRVGAGLWPGRPRGGLDL
eukprot:1710700-Rhodomonas_salina.1